MLAVYVETCPQSATTAALNPAESKVLPVDDWHFTWSYYELRTVVSSISSLNS